MLFPVSIEIDEEGIMKRFFALSLLLLTSFACNNTIQKEEEDPSKGMVRKRTERAVRNQEENFQSTPKIKSMRQEEQIEEERIKDHEKL